MEWNITRNPIRLINEFKEKEFKKFTNYEWSNNFNEIVKCFLEKNHL
jgi:hypothetical protein